VDFPYTPFEGLHGPSFRPCLGVTLSYGNRKFPVGSALVDTGADVTLLPLEIAKVLAVELDESRAITIGSAGGGIFTAVPSLKPIGYAIEQPGFRPICWKGIPYFTTHQSTILLGHYQCLDYLELTFKGPSHVLHVATKK
jgi:hypothetical protein